MKKINKTQLKVIDDKFVSHPDYFAHLLRWQHVYKWFWSHVPHDTKIPDRLKLSILDLGCGDFQLLKFLYRNAKTLLIRKYTGVDIKDLSDILETLPARCPKSFIQADCSEEVIKGNYSMVVCFEVLEHMDKDSGIRLLKNISDGMSKNSVAFLSTPNYNRISKAANHIYEWEFSELESELKKNFIIEKVFGTFASQKDIKQGLSGSELTLYEKLREYYHFTFLSVIFAPLYPENSRNCLWRLRKKNMNNAKCEKCPDLVHSRKLYPFGKPTWGYGKSPCKVMFVGEAPGKAGCGTTGIAFTGDRSGKFFQECLKECGLTKEDVYVTNIVKCCPENNRTPYPTEIANCEKYLIQEIEKVDPTYIIPLGAPATHFFIAGSMKILVAGVYAGMFAHQERIILPLYHPAYALRIGGMKEYKEDFKFRIKMIQQLEDKL